MSQKHRKHWGSPETPFTKDYVRPVLTLKKGNYSPIPVQSLVNARFKEISPSIFLGTFDNISRPQAVRTWIFIAPAVSFGRFDNFTSVSEKTIDAGGKEAIMHVIPEPNIFSFIPDIKQGLMEYAAKGASFDGFDIVQNDLFAWMQEAVTRCYFSIPPNYQGVFLYEVTVSFRLYLKFRNPKNVFFKRKTIGPGIFKCLYLVCFGPGIEDKILMLFRGSQ